MTKNPDSNNSLTDEQLAVIVKLTQKMSILGASAKTTGSVTVGPVVSIYRFQPVGNTRVSQIEALATDFACELGVEDVVVKRLPGENTVSIFVPNAERRPIKFLETTRDLWLVKDFYSIPLNLGVTHIGEALIEDLSQLPHLLIAGATGSGKSTLLSTLATSIVACKSPDEVKLVLSDTKGVEFRQFEGISHLLYKVSYDAETTIKQLQFLIEDMEERLKLLGSCGVRNILEYNQKYNPKLPYIVCIFDELADIMEVKGGGRGKPGQDAVAKLAQKARASGIHMLAATQRPSVDVVKGSIKANFPARIAFRLVTETDSRTVLGCGGAEHLLAQGDMFYLSPNKPGLVRAHAPLTRNVDITATLETIAKKETVS